MSSTKLRVFWFLVFLILIFEITNFADICVRQLKRFSDVDLISWTIYESRTSLASHYDIKSIDDARRFYNDNPDCCVVRRFNAQMVPSQLLQRIFGRPITEVQIEAIRSSGGNYLVIKSLNSCGTILGRTGMEIDAGDDRLDGYFQNDTILRGNGVDRLTGGVKEMIYWLELMLENMSSSEALDTLSQNKRTISAILWKEGPASTLN